MSPQTLVFCNRRRAFDERKNSSLSLACERSNLILLPLFKFFVSPLLFLHRISLEFLFAWFPFVRLHFSFMHVFSAPKAWSLLLALFFAPCCWFIILLFLSFWNTGGHSLNVLLFNFRFKREREREKKWGERALKKNFILFLFLPMCSSTWFLWFFLSLDLSTAPLVTREKRGKNSTRVWRDGRSLSLIRVQPTKSTPKRSHWEEIDLVLDGTNNRRVRY